MLKAELFSAMGWHVMPLQHGDQYKVPFQHLLAGWDEASAQKLIGNGQHLMIGLLVQVYLLACAQPAPGDPTAPLPVSEEEDESCEFLGVLSQVSVDCGK